MIIDGRAVAARILGSLQQTVLQLPAPPRLTVFTCAPNFETQKFLALKKRRAEEVGIMLQIVEFPADSSQSEIIQSIEVAHQTTDGIIVQLPFPTNIDIDTVLQSVKSTHDVDAIHYDGSITTILPPVVGAIAELANVHQIDFQNKQVVVIGQGRLVGRPAALYAKSCGANVTVVTKDNEADLISMTKIADILITGAGVPGLIKSEMVREGVVIFDAGTSEDGGELVGDVDSDCAYKAALFTPVPGGIGPITVAVLLRNVVEAALRKD